MIAHRKHIQRRWSCVVPSTLGAIDRCVCCDCDGRRNRRKV